MGAPTLSNALDAGGVNFSDAEHGCVSAELRPERNVNVSGMRSVETEEIVENLTWQL